MICFAKRFVGSVIKTAAFIILTALLLWVAMNVICFSTTCVKDGLTAEETLEEYFRFYDSGNLYGMALIREEKPPGIFSSFDIWYFLDDIELTEYRYIGVPDAFMEEGGYSEGMVFMTSFSEGYGNYTNMYEYVLCKRKNACWRLAAVGGLYVG